LQHIDDNRGVIGAAHIFDVALVVKCGPVAGQL